jgi:hypothetical protein
MLAAARLFPGVYAPYASQRPQDQIVFAIPSHYISAPSTSLTSLSALMSVSHSQLASPELLPILCPTSSIFTQSQNSHVTHMPLMMEDARSVIFHSHICACDDMISLGVTSKTPESRNKYARCGQSGHYKKNCEWPHTLYSKRKCKVPRAHPYYDQSKCGIAVSKK